MHRATRRAVLLGGGSTALAACAPDWQISDGGAEEPKGGIGGTGIIGTLTEFGSLWVNGLRVVVPADLSVESAVGPLSQDRLAVGQNLTIEAATVDGVLSARRIRLVHPVIGPVQEVSEGGRLLRIANVVVKAEEGALSEAKIGETVAVSGAWRRTRVVASRIARVSPDTPSSVSGTVRFSRQSGPVQIGTQVIALTDGTALEPGSFATAFGALRGDVLQARAVETGRFTGAAGSLASLSVEGYFAPTAEAPFHTIDGLGHRLSASSAISDLLGHRVLLQGSYDGTFVVERGTTLADNPDTRRLQLRQI